MDVSLHDDLCRPRLSFQVCNAHHLSPECEKKFTACRGIRCFGTAFDPKLQEVVPKVPGGGPASGMSKPGSLTPSVRVVRRSKDRCWGAGGELDLAPNDCGYCGVFRRLSLSRPVKIMLPMKPRLALAPQRADRWREFRISDLCASCCRA